MAEFHTAHWLIVDILGFTFFPSAVVSALSSIWIEHSISIVFLIFVVVMIVASGMVALFRLAAIGQSAELPIASASFWAQIPTWDQLSKRWWLWLCVGLGVSIFSLWLSPQFPDAGRGIPATRGSAPNDAGHDTTALQKAEQELAILRARQSSPPLSMRMAFQIVDIVANVGLLATMPLPRSPPEPSRWSIIFSVPPGQNVNIRELMSDLIKRGLGDRVVILYEPNPHDLDAPKLQSQDDGHIVIHGKNVLAQRLWQAFTRCFHVETTARIPEGVDTFYRITEPDSFVWIEIGKGPLWLDPPACQQ